MSRPKDSNGTRASRTMETLLPNECRWPIGDPQLPGFHFCGEIKQDGYPYCKRHAAQATTPSHSRARAARSGPQ